MRSFARYFVLGFLTFAPALPLFAEETPAELPVNFLFRDQFYLSPELRARYHTSQAPGFLVVEKPNPESNSNIAIVTGFAPQALRTRSIKDIQTVDQAQEWIEKQKKTVSFQGVPIQKLSLPVSGGRTKEMFWVGNKGFDSFDQASSEIAMVQSIIEKQKGDFPRALELAEKYSKPEEGAAPPPEEIAKSEAQFQREEEIMLRWVDQLDIGEKLWGPFQGMPAGEPILYQSFGEGSWRSTNLAEKQFNAIVSYWTNRMVFKGIRAPFNTIDPYVEITAALESSGNEGGSQLDTVVGLEWRPLARATMFDNYRPWGGISLLNWAKNYRFYIQMMDRRNLKDEIANIRDYDFRFGVDIFYEWGIDLPPIDQTPGKGFAGLVRDYVWGEYYGNYGWRWTNFTAEEDFSAWILDTSIILGIKTPPVRMPENPINENLVLMPYFRFAIIGNSKLSNPSDNRAYLAVGVRWMPFRSYRFANNEWLFKTKLFAEYLAIGKVQTNKQPDRHRVQPDEDWRIGIAWSLRRF